MSKIREELHAQEEESTINENSNPTIDQIDEKSSILTAEAVMKRRRRLTKIVRRTLLITLATIILIVGGIFFLDQYKAEAADYHNEYDKEYWATLPGFKHYDEWYSELVNNKDINNSAYVSPYKSDDSLIKKMQSTRYQEELDVLLSPIKDNYTSLNRSINTMTESLFEFDEDNDDFESLRNKWLCYIILGSGVDSTEAIKSYDVIVNATSNLSLTEEEYNEKLSNGTLTYKYLTVDKGGTVDFTTFMKAMLNESYVEGTKLNFTDRFQKIIELCSLENITEDAYQYFVVKGYTSNIDTFYSAAIRGGSAYARTRALSYGISQLDFASIIYFDEGHDGSRSAFERGVIPEDIDALNDLIAKRDDIENIVNAGEAHRESLSKWSEYIRSGAMSYQLLATKGNYEFWLNVALTTFKVVDKTDPLNPVEWYSNPTTTEDGNHNTELNILELWYAKTGSSPNNYGTYEYSVATSFRGNSKGVSPNYATKVFDSVTEDGKNSTVIQVWYRLEERGINYTYFPKYISEEKLNELMARNAQFVADGAEYDVGMPIQDLLTLIDKNGISAYTKLFEGSIYKLVTENNANNQFGGIRYYEYSGNLENVSQLNIATMYYLYQHCGFTTADLNEQNDYFQNISDEMGTKMTIGNEVPSDASFSVAIQYELSEDGLNVSIPGNSIIETGDELVVYVDILKYFTATKKGTEGYTIIPDGSGAVLNHDNGKTSYSPYIKRLYTTDLSQTTNVMQPETEDIMLPMYAVINTGIKNGVIADVTKGAAQFELNADVSGRGGDEYNKNYFRIYYRESQEIKISTYANKIVKYNANRMSEDVSIAYKFLKEDVVNGGYSSVAKVYRDLLVNRYDMEDKKDETDEIVLDIDVIASYQFQNNFLGIVYSDKETLTTYAELKEIIKNIETYDIQNINVFYEGWRNSTLKNKSFKSLNTLNDLGNLKELKEVESDDKVTVYPYLNFGLIEQYQETFGQYHYNSRNVIGEIISIYPYDLNSNTWNKKAQVINVLSPRYYVAFAQSLSDSYTKLFKIGKDKEILNNIAIDNLGSELTGDYQKDKEMFKTTTVQQQIKVLQILKDSGIDNINLYKPFDYAFKYTDNARNIPYDSTQYEILNYSIPFYQLVVNGLFDYSGESINANSEDGINRHIMKILETGSNISFTFTYKNSEVLLATDYNKYYYTHYVEWMNDVKTVYSSIKNTGIEGYRLVDHKYLSESVYQVIYENESTGNQIVIILNYSRIQYNTGTGISVPAKSYKVI